MLIDRLVTGPFQENSYLVAAGRGRPCVLIDPGDEAGRIADRIGELDLSPELILNTHGHLDHIGAVADLQERYGIPFALHPADRFLVTGVNEQARMFGLHGYRDPTVDRDLVAGESVHAAGLDFRILHTPGHSPGHVALSLGAIVFGGDCLFQGSIGRSDLPGSDPEALHRTLHEVFLAMADMTVIHPGHGPSTTIGAERRSNPFLTGAIRW